jgi:hypothetical protein
MLLVYMWKVKDACACSASPTTQGREAAGALGTQGCESGNGCAVAWARTDCHQYCRWTPTRAIDGGTQD